MPLPYRPKFLPATAATRRARLAPVPHTAPAASHGDRVSRTWSPGPVLVAADSAVLFRDGPAPSWPGGREPAAPVRPRSLTLRIFLLQAAILAAALAWGAAVMPGPGQ